MGCGWSRGLETQRWNQELFPLSAQPEKWITLVCFLYLIFVWDLICFTNLKNLFLIIFQIEPKIWITLLIWAPKKLIILLIWAPCQLLAPWCQQALSHLKRYQCWWGLCVCWHHRAWSWQGAQIRSIIHFFSAQIKSVLHIFGSIWKIIRKSFF